MLRAYRLIKKAQYANQPSFNSFYSEKVFDILRENNINVARFEVIVPIHLLGEIVHTLEASNLADKYATEIIRIKEDIQWAKENDLIDIIYHMFK